MDCAKIRELLVAYLDGELTESEKNGIVEHLTKCGQCRKHAEEITGVKKISEYIPKLKTSSSYIKTLREKIKIAQQQRAYKLTSIRILSISLLLLFSLFVVYEIKNFKQEEIAKAFWSRYGNEQINIRKNSRVEWKKFPINSLLYAGYGIMTEKKQYFALECNDGSIIALTQNSELKFSRTEKNERINASVVKGGIYFKIAGNEKEFLINAGGNKIFSRGCEILVIESENISVITVIKGEGKLISGNNVILLSEKQQVFIKEGLKPEIFAGKEVDLAVNEAKTYRPLTEGQFNNFVYNTKANVKDILLKISGDMGLNVIIKSDIKFADDREIMYSAYGKSFSDFLAEILKKNKLSYRITEKGITIFREKMKYTEDRFRLFPVDKTIPLEYRELIKQYYKKINQHKIE